MAAVRGRAKACPAKRHFPAKRSGAKLVAQEHTDTWVTTEDTVAGWTHIRGFEKLVAPPSASKFNVGYDVHDYATRGNSPQPPGAGRPNRARPDDRRPRDHDPDQTTHEVRLRPAPVPGPVSLWWTSRA
jgi:hypothetical protein